MANCRRYRAAIQELTSGTLADRQENELLTHLDTCAACRQLYELHEELSDPELFAPRPPAAALAEVRRGVLRTLRTEGPEHRATPSIWQLFTRRPGWVLATWVAMALGSALLGRLSAPASPTGEQALLAQLQQAAISHHQLSDVEGSRYLFSDVTWRDLSDEQVALSFDVSTHLELNLDKDDPLTTELLVQSLVNPVPLGGRLKAISRARNLQDPRVRQALIRAMLHDPDLAVRLEAQAQLAAHPAKPEVDEAFIAVLAHEASVQMRLLAVDFLAARHVSPDVLSRALAANASPGTSAVLWRARSYDLEL